MRKFFLGLVVLLLGNSSVGQGQSVLPEAKLTVTLPGAAWSAFTRQEQGEKLVYIAKRQPIVDKEGRSIIPNIAFLLEEIPATVDIKTFSTELQRDLTATQEGNAHAAKVIKTYQPGEKNGVLRQRNMLAYQLMYLDQESLSHTVYVVYLLHNNVGVQAIFDSTTDVFAHCEPEFLQAIHSITKLP